MNSVNQACDICKQKIHYGAPYIAICYNIENMERDHLSQNDTVNVITSDQIFTMCGKCGNKRNANATSSVLELAFKLPNPRLN